MNSGFIKIYKLRNLRELWIVIYAMNSLLSHTRRPSDLLSDSSSMERHNHTYYFILTGFSIK